MDNLADLYAEMDAGLKEVEDFLAETLDEAQSMRSILWARMPEARLSPEEQVEVARSNMDG